MQQAVFFFFQPLNVDLLFVHGEQWEGGCGISVWVGGGGLLSCPQPRKTTRWKDNPPAWCFTHINFHHLLLGRSVRTLLPLTDTIRQCAMSVDVKPSVSMVTFRVHQL